MRWNEAKVYALREVGRDGLGTPVCEPELSGTVLVRPAPSCVLRDDNPGNSFGYVRTTFLSKASHDAFDGCAFMEVAGERYEVKRLSVALSMTLVVTERYKVQQ